MAVSTFSKPHDIVSYIKRRYIDSGQAITSCLQDVLKAQRPRTIQESLKNIKMTVNQLLLFKNMDYLHLLTKALLDNLVIKCFRQADVEEYYLNLNKYILEDFPHSTPAASPGHHEDTGLNTSMVQILNQTDGCLKICKGLMHGLIYISKVQIINLDTEILILGDLLRITVLQLRR